jgi:serine/threonine-protein kinase
VLGPVELLDSEGKELRTVLAQPKRLALLACLVVGPRGFRRRDSLIALLWPELDTTRARAALNQAVRFLRKELGESAGPVIISRGDEELGVDPATLWCDAIELRDHMEAGRCSEVLELYRGDLLEGFHGEPSASFEEWLMRERELLRATAARAARELAATHERDENFTPAVESARRAVDLAAADERMVRQLLQLLDRIGDRAGAVQAYEDFAGRLARDLDVEPSPETKAVIDRIRSRVTPSEVVERAHRESKAQRVMPSPTNGAPVQGRSDVPQPPASSSTRWYGIVAWVALGAALGSAITVIVLR